MGAVYQPNAKVSALDQIAKVLQVGSLMYGIKNDAAKSKALAVEQQRIADGQLTPKEQIEYGQHYNFSDKQTDGSFHAKSPEGKDLWLTSKDKTTTGGTLTQEQFLNQLKEGAREVKSGTPGSRPVSYLDNGKVVQSSILLKTKADVENDPNARLQAAPADVRSKVGLLANALGNVTEYEKAFSSGDAPTRVNSNTPYVGTFFSDTKLTSAARLLDEAVGRLESGGAIGPAELKTFRAMGPQPGDSDDMMVHKIGQQRQFLEDRLSGYGFSPQDLGKIKGYDVSKLGYDFNSQNTRSNLLTSHSKSKFRLIPDAVAGEKEAPKDPSEQIAKVNGVTPEQAKHILNKRKKP